ncbi:hypothetical protein LshimejAT787_0203370 [Lyophyllum shimeji]|uniref:Uncharacterized protein n=1 Tax=Lyophyllum shimeji TaxID=47721 RepID=A0A9P3PG47_LYOSH|nr:hypothetical protein LshimejAT787_0203370 [Lyophyllum shimeji]
MNSEARLLQGLGNALLKNLAQCTTITLLYGFFLVLFAFAVITPLRRGSLTHPTWMMLGATLTSFICVSMYWGAFLALFTLDIRGTLVENPDAPLDKNKFAAVIRQEFVADQITLWAPLVLTIPSDCIVVWRAWVLFAEKRRVMIVPVVLWLCLTVTVFANLVVSASLKRVSKRTNDLFSASIALSTATNFASTSLIMYKLWSYRRFLGGLQIDERKMPSRATKIMIVLVESGMMYLVFQVTGFIFQLIPPAPKNVAFGTAMNIFFPTYCIITGMYPMIVVLLVKRQRSIVETFRLSTILADNGAADVASASRRPPTFGHLSFASSHDADMSSIASMTHMSPGSWVAGEVPNGNIIEARSVRSKGTENASHTATAPF